MSNWENGDQSSSWHDSNTDSTNTHVTFYYNCRAFPRMRIRKENFGPDTTVGEEEIDCAAYDDAVYAGDVPADNYHFDVQLPVFRNITGDYRIYW